MVFLVLFFLFVTTRCNINILVTGKGNNWQNKISESVNE